MLRSFLIYLSKVAWARQMVTGWAFAWRAAARFVAGEQLEDAIAAVRALNKRGINATLDLLGEHTTNIEQAHAATRDVLQIIEAIDQTAVHANVSIKLTQIGLSLDEKTCERNLRQILEAAQRHGTFVRIDMEDSPWTEKTLALFRELLLDCGCENLGVVLQSYLYRSEADMTSLMKLQARVRLCKGAYKEPAAIAFPKKKDVNTSYDRLAKILIDGALAAGAPQVSANGKIPPIAAIASHDAQRIARAKSYAQEVGLPKRAMEFQLLYGIRRDLQEQLAAERYPVRVYVPFGTQWYPYTMRRLAERPANLWFFLSNFFRR
jgi:proline dehydrogenase